MPRFDGDNRSLYLLTAYKLVGISAGLAFGFMGYRLFMAGVFEHAGNLEALFGKEHLILKAAAPGTFFAVLGCVIIVATIWRGLNFTQDHKGKLGSNIRNFGKALDAPKFRSESQRIEISGEPSISEPPVYKAALAASKDTKD